MQTEYTWSVKATRKRPSVKTLKVRVKDRHVGVLQRMAREVNTVWNYCNDLGQQVFRREGRFLTGFDFNRYTTGVVRDGRGRHAARCQDPYPR